MTKLVVADDSMSPYIKYIAVESTEQLISQLIDNSKQPHIRQFTPRDADNRFKNLDTTKKWLTEDREVHWLIGSNNDLAGIIWYRRAAANINSRDKNMETFAIRLYEGYTGKGLARPFMTQSLRIHNQQRTNESKPLNLIWLETETTNDIARSLYEKFGYKVYGTENGRLTMILPVSAQINILSASH